MGHFMLNKSNGKVLSDWKLLLLLHADNFVIMSETKYGLQKGFIVINGNWILKLTI